MIIYLSIIFLLIVVYLLVPKPIYNGPTKVITLDYINFQRDVINNKDYIWLIQFDCSWSPESQYLSADYASVSNRYTTDILKFGKIDLARFSGLADKYKIDISGRSWQLPTFILFKNGKEVRRIPTISPSGDVVRVLIDKVYIFFKFRKV